MMKTPERSGSRASGLVGAALFGLLVGAFVAGPAAEVASAAPSTGAAVSVAASVPASALSDVATTGWVRLAHLSSDTAAVDIQLTALSGGTVVSSVQNVGYGQVSSYIALPQGAYIVSMAPAGGDMKTPVIQASITVASGQPVTVAAYGKNATLATTVFADDLTAPAAGESRVRVVQGSTALPVVTVSTSTGTVLASGAASGTATPYSNVAAGPSTLTVAGGSTTSSAQVDLPAGAISTLFVLDNASGGVTVTSVADASSVAALPTGGIQTGGGGTALRVDAGVVPARGGASVGAVALAVGVALAVALVAGVALRHSSRRRLGRASALPDPLSLPIRIR